MPVPDVATAYAADMSKPDLNFPPPSEFDSISRTEVLVASKIWRTISNVFDKDNETVSRVLENLLNNNLNHVIQYLEQKYDS